MSNQVCYYINAIYNSIFDSLCEPTYSNQYINLWVNNNNNNNNTVFLERISQSLNALYKVKVKTKYTISSTIMV